MANILFLERFSLNDKTLLYCNLRGAAQFGKNGNLPPPPIMAKILYHFHLFATPLNTKPWIDFEKEL